MQRTEVPMMYEDKSENFKENNGKLLNWSS